MKDKNSYTPEEVEEMFEAYIANRFRNGTFPIRDYFVKCSTEKGEKYESLVPEKIRKKISKVEKKVKEPDEKLNLSLETEAVYNNNNGHPGL